MGSLGYTVLMIWMLIAIAHLKSRKRGQTVTAGYHVKWFPYTTWLAILALTAILIGVVLTTSIVITLVTAGIYMFITVAYLFKGRKPNVNG